MRIATWNVNSLRVRLPQVLEWLKDNPVDVLAMQETKLTDDKFPAQEIEAAGYRAVFNGQKTYNGVAILSREEAQDVAHDIPGLEDDQKRVLSAAVAGTRVICVYVPNGQSVGSDKYDYKLRWLDALIRYVRRESERHEKLVVLGDFNIAPRIEDTHDPEVWEGNIFCSEPERSRFQSLLDFGLNDTWTRFDAREGKKQYTWWDYRAAGFRRNLGLRIDHILASQPLAESCTRCAVDLEPRKNERPSDHAPVVAAFDG